MKFKRITFLLVLAFMLILHPHLNASQNNGIYQLSDEIQISLIAENIFLVTHSFPWPANSLIVRYPNRFIIWVDTPYTDSATSQIWDWVKSDLGNEKIIEINTGFHNDNLGGNGFLTSKHVDTFGSNLTVQLINDRSEKTKKQILNWLKKPKLKKYFIAFSKAEYLPPSKVFDIKPDTRHYLVDELAEIYYPGPSHSPDNLVVYFPDKNLLFGGCMVKSVISKNLGFTGDAVMHQWPISLEKVLTRYEDATIVVPGHGEIGGLELIKHTLTLFNP